MPIVSANPLNQPNTLERSLKSARSTLLGVIAFTVVNMVLALTASDSYFLFSAVVPYVLTLWGAIFCGLYPAEYYQGEGAYVQIFDKPVFAVFLVLALLVLALFFVSWLLSKKHSGWLIAALVFFVLDTVAMFAILGLQFNTVLDIVFHIWVIFSLSMGIRASVKMKQTPPVTAASFETVPVEEAGEEAADALQTPSDSRALRAADMGARARVFVETETAGHAVVYRRVKHTNELVIDGMVYDEYEAVMEMPHTLVAYRDGHRFEACFDGGGHVIIRVDGQEAAKKRRFW